MSVLMEFGEYVLIGGVSFVFLFLVLRQRARTHRALNEPIPDDQCVACQSRKITTMAPDAFRCGGCGFTWGDGIKRIEADKRRAALDGMSSEERHAQGVSNLVEAGDLLVAALAALEQGANQLGWDMMVGGGMEIDGTGDFYSQTRQAMIRTAASDINRAQRQIQYAADALGEVAHAGAGPAPEMNSDVAVLDILAGSMVFDLMAHQQLGQLRDHAETMRDNVQQALGQLQVQSPE